MTAAPDSAVALAAPHPLAVAAGEEAARAGGNALDAALAAAAVLVVAYPHQCALGGDLTALVREPGGSVTAVLSLGAAPAAVDADALRAAGERMPRQGALTVTVPGIVAGWAELAGLGARLGLRAPLLRAAALAAEGTPVVPGLARAIVDRLDGVAADPGLAAIFLSDGEPLAAGAPLVQPALARTLEAVAAEPRAMYEGEIAAALVDFLRAGGSAMSEADFAAHAAERPEPLAWTQPLPTLSPSGRQSAHHSAGAARWWAAPPPAQGATALAMLGDAGEGPLARARAAQAARARLLGDPRGGEVDLDGLLAPAPLEPAAQPPRGTGDTVAVTAIDSEGRAVTLIQSVFQTFGSGLLEPRTGVVLHNRGAAFSLQPGHPAEVAGGRRPPHTLCPLIGEAEGVSAAVGCQGGSAQPLILSQVAAGALDPGASLDAVLAAPRWVVGDRELGFEAETVLAEPGAEAALAPELAAEGAPPLVLGADREDRCGHVQVARAVDGRLEAAADPRADGTAAVVPGAPR